MAPSMGFPVSASTICPSNGPRTSGPFWQPAVTIASNNTATHRRRNDSLRRIIAGSSEPPQPPPAVGIDLEPYGIGEQHTVTLGHHLILRAAGADLHK